MEYKTQFNETRKNIANYFKDKSKVKEWAFSSDLVFTVFDFFMERLELVKVCDGFFSKDSIIKR